VVRLVRVVNGGAGRSGQRGAPGVAAPSGGRHSAAPGAHGPTDHRSL